MPSELYLYEIQEKRARRHRRLRWTLLLSGLYGVVLGILWLLLVSPLPRFQNISISGSTKIQTSRVLDAVYATIFKNSRRWEFLGLDNLLAWPKNFRLQNLALLPAAKDIVLKRDFLKKTINITVSDRQPYGIWCVHKESPDCYWFDEEGVLFQKTAMAEGSLIPAVNDYSGRALGLGSRILPERFMKNLFPVLAAVKNLELGIKEIRLDALEREEVSAATYFGTVFYFGLRNSANNLADAINALKQKMDVGKLQYADFRVENRIYYK